VNEWFLMICRRVNELWNVVGLCPLTFSLELIPTPAGNHISDIVR
jgi:hypothetical protein